MSSDQTMSGPFLGGAGGVIGGAGVAIGGGHTELPYPVPNTFPPPQRVEIWGSGGGGAPVPFGDTVGRITPLTAIPSVDKDFYWINEVRLLREALLKLSERPTQDMIDTLQRTNDVLHQMVEFWRERALCVEDDAASRDKAGEKPKADPKAFPSNAMRHAPADHDRNIDKPYEPAPTPPD